MKGIGRNLLFWGKTLEKMVLFMTLWIIGLVAFMTLMEGGSFWEVFGGQMPSYLIMLAFLSLFVSSMNGVQIYYPLTVSFGSTRKQSFVAMQLILHLIVAEYIAMICLFSYFFNAQVWQLVSRYFVSVAGAFFIILAMGNLISTTYMRYGRALGMLLYVILLILIISVCIIGFSVAGKDAGMDWMVQGRLDALLLSPAILALGLVLDAVIIAIFYGMIRKQNLKFA